MTEPATEPEQPDQVNKDAEGGEAGFKCPHCGKDIPTPDLKRMLGELLHQIAVQLEQGDTTDKTPETGAEEAPTEEEPAGETVPPAPAPSQGPEEPKPAESLSEGDEEFDPDAEYSVELERNGERFLDDLERVRGISPLQVNPNRDEVFFSIFSIKAYREVDKLVDKYRFDMAMESVSEQNLREPKAKELDHEITRIDTMTDIELMRRMKKVTKPQKMLAFLQALEHFERTELVKLAKKKLRELGYSPTGKFKESEETDLEEKNKISINRLTRAARKAVKKGLDPVTGEKLSMVGDKLYSPTLNVHFYEEMQKEGLSFKPLMGELLVPADNVPAHTEVRVIDRLEKTAVVEFQNRLHHLPAESVLIFPEGSDLASCLTAVKEGKMTSAEASRKRLHCREKAQNLGSLPEMTVLSNSKLMVAYLPDTKRYKAALTELKRISSTGPIEESHTIYCYPKTEQEREDIAKCVEKHEGHLIQTRVAFGYDPNKPISEQLGGGDENSDIVASVNDLFLAAYNNIRQQRQLLVDAQANLLKAVAMLQGGGIGKKTTGAITKLTTKLDIEALVKEQTKMLAELNKTHDMFVAEFPEAQQQEELPKEEPTPEVPAAPEAPAPEPAPAAAPAPAPEPAPAAPPPPPAESVIDKAVKVVMKSEDWPLLESLFQEAAPYGTIAKVVKDLCPEFDPMQIQKVVHKLI